MADYRDEQRWRDDRPGEAWREREDRSRGTERDRPVTERAGDEIRSWFGDDEARRRREWDERREGSANWGERGRSQESWEGGGRTWRNDERASADLNRERDFGRSDRYANADEGMNYGTRTYANPPSGYGRGSSGYRGTSGLETARGSEGSGSGGRLDNPRELSTDRGWDTGPYVGRGPRDYKRSDDRIREDLCERLTRHGRIDATDIVINVQNGEVTLEGSVDDRESKRLAEDVAESVFGVKDVNNRIKVYRQERDMVGTSGRRDFTGRSELGETPRAGENSGSVLGLAGTANTPEVTPPDRGEGEKKKG